MDRRERFEAEIQLAMRARERGNEGQARVCARRAAGIAATEFYERRGKAIRSKSALDVLRLLAEDETTPPEVRVLVERLMQPVDTEFKLPKGVDLVADARELRERLMGGVG